MRYNDPSNQPNSGSIIGDTSDPAAASTQDFQDFWEELASRFKNNSRVMFGIVSLYAFHHAGITAYMILYR